MTDRSRLIKAIAAQLQNAFCPTGPGGGVDPSCSPSDAGSSADKWEKFSAIRGRRLVRRESHGTYTFLIKTGNLKGQLSYLSSDGYREELGTTSADKMKQKVEEHHKQKAG